MHRRAGKPALQLGEGEGEASNNLANLASYQVTPARERLVLRSGCEAERAFERRFRLRADGRGRGLAVLEEDHRRDGHHPVLHGQALLLVDVDLHELDLAGALLRDLLEDRSDGVAGTAPLGPEVEYDGCLGLQDFLLEGLLRDVKCHETHSFLSYVSLRMPRFERRGP